jgi:hypothetical protein
MKKVGSFTIKNSGKIPDQYYIDYDGSCEIGEIIKLTGIEKRKLEKIYSSYGAELDKSSGMYYFPSRNHALDAIKVLNSYFLSRGAGKLVFLTFEEIEYIHQALINEGTNIINVKNDLKRGIFDKFSL